MHKHYGTLPCTLVLEPKLTLKNLTLLKSRDGKQKFKLVKRVKSKYKELGIRIGLTRNYLDSMDECWDSLKSVCEVVMKEWLDGQGQEIYPVTWEGLYRLLTDIGCAQVAEELKAAVKAA